MIWLKNPYPLFIIFSIYSFLSMRKNADGSLARFIKESIIIYTTFFCAYEQYQTIISSHLVIEIIINIISLIFFSFLLVAEISLFSY